MLKKLFIFEDSTYDSFYPLTHLRPIYFLRPGIRPLYQKIIDAFKDFSPCLLCRPEIAGITSEMTDIPVNEFDLNNMDELIFINGRVKNCEKLIKSLNEKGNNIIIASQGETVAIKVTRQFYKEEIESLINGGLDNFIEKSKVDLDIIEADVSLYNYLWDFINDIERAIVEDGAYYSNIPNNRFSTDSIRSKNFPGVGFIKPEQIFTASDVEILPGAVLNASDGPIYIDSRVSIEPHTYIIGPVYIGPDTLLVGGKVTGCSIGPVCRIGGEVEETIIQGYSNKYHAGFLGHGYIGEWVNFGAMTTNSDLRNDYGTIKVSINGKIIDTGSMKVGSFIGDHTKTAIGTLLNTGINIGVSCNILGDGLVAEKEIPSFTWFSSRHKLEYKLNKAIETARRTMSRRNKELSDAMEKSLAEIHRLRVKK